MPGMSVAENLLLADLPGRYGLTDPAERDRKAEALLARVGADFRPATMVEQLAVADRQLVAIAKALAVDAKVVLMDEPSAPLTANELDRLFAVIGELKRAGCGVLYISHRLEELHRVGSIVTVLRDGGLVGNYLLPDTPLRSIVAAIDRWRARGRVESPRGSRGGPRTLDVRSVVVPQACDIEGVRVWPGEIVGIAGLGRLGEDDVPAGPVRRRPGARGRRVRYAAVPPEGPGRSHRALGVGLVPEDRHLQGLVVDHSVADNLALASLPRLSRFGFVGPRRVAAFAQRLVKALR